VNPLSRGVIATSEKAAIHEAVRITEGLTNGYKSISVLGHLRQSTAQKELLSSNPLEGGLHRLEERSLLAAASKQPTDQAQLGAVADEP
jgi:hypothetical protein